MKIGIIGPNKIDEKSVNKRKILLNKVAKTIADSKNSIVLTPDRNSLLEYFGDKYIEYGGKNIFLVIPTEEVDYKDYLNTEIGTVIDCKDWDRQANEFNRQCDIFICIGYAWGALKEIACTQYFNKKKVYILNEFISSELPNELNFLVEYIDIKDIANII
ncbi:MAG: hypothetical protein WCK26_01835 [Candidatus Saccharibacteria bacterium]